MIRRTIYLLTIKDLNVKYRTYPDSHKYPHLCIDTGAEACKGRLREGSTVFLKVFALKQDPGKVSCIFLKYCIVEEEKGKISGKLVITLHVLWTQKLFL